MKPKKGEPYWMINSRFEVRQTIHTASKKSLKRIAVGNCFKTRAEARAFREFVMQREEVNFDKKIAYAEGSIVGAFIAAMICLVVLR